MKFVRQIFASYWVEMVAVPPCIVALCYMLYGSIYFSNWGNFFKITLPWLACAVITPVCCHQVRDYTLARFPKLGEWPQRVSWNFVGFLGCVFGFAALTYALLGHFQYAQLTPKMSDVYRLLLISVMCVLINATLYEAITYFDKWKAALTEAEALEKLSLETQFQSLQSQLNPHFLFNSLNVLSSLIAENPRQAEAFVDELSNVYRYLLRSNERELATVEEELRFARSFFHLLETRHERGIAFEIKVPPVHGKQYLPALALQILLENAVKHNEVNPEVPLCIEVLEHGPDALLVRNNIRPKTARTASNRVGLDNLRQRYALLGQEGFEVRQEGPYFEVVLPLLKE